MHPKALRQELRAPGGVSGDSPNPKPLGKALTPNLRPATGPPERRPQRTVAARRCVRKSVAFGNYTIRSE